MGVLLLEECPGARLDAPRFPVVAHLFVASYAGADILG
jgi:hypothetical protein